MASPEDLRTPRTPSRRPATHEAVRVALRIDTNPTDDDWDDHYGRIRALIDAYVASPEGRGEDASTLMSRLAVCIADVIPMAVRKRL